MTPEQYDAWYRTPRGSWIGETEYRLLCRLLAAPSGASVLDVGCGTGYFTRRFALDGQRVTGIDLEPAALRFALAHRAAGERYVCGDARRLPFNDAEFDFCISVTALCFIADELAALVEMLRVTRRAVVLGLLNRRSLLYLQKGRGGGSGAYRGARWHTAREVRKLFAAAGGEASDFGFAVLLPAGGLLARATELAAPSTVPFGAFLAARGSTAPGHDAGTRQPRNVTDRLHSAAASRRSARSESAR